jgi:Superfamily II DNA/RNA helicase required for DNA uptake (late competence protein)
MKCLRCLNSDTDYFYTRDSIVYCRKCIAYGRMIETLETQETFIYENKVMYHLEYSLTKQQKEISRTLLERYQQKKNTKLKAVCGAGKTEILYDVLTYALNQGERVCLTIPRRELVKELAQRITSQFQNLNYSVVYGGQVNDLDGQLVICTCHQLFRYPQAFALLILDEEDAFPFKNNEVLQNIVAQSCNGQYIYMSATLDSSEANISLHTRYHGHRLPVPKCCISGHWLSILCMIKKLYRYKKQNKPVLIYVPAIKNTYEIHKLLSYLKIRCNIAHSKCTDMQESILQLKQRQLDCIITTTILERGITIENIQVIILGGQHRIYDSQTLLQICGRVGRKINYPTGDITIYTVYKTKAIRECIRTLKEDNAYCV